MNIAFHSLQKSHFTLLLKWLETPHVKKWWDPDITWNTERIREKYKAYVKGYKLVEGIPKEIQAFIIHVDDVPIGYVQLYNAYDFPKSEPLTNLPKSLGAFDMFIGEEEFLGKGLGSKVLKFFLDSHAGRYEGIIADPDKDNRAAIRIYEKAGFAKAKENHETGEIWMLRKMTSNHMTFSTSSNDQYNAQIMSELRQECENLTGISPDFRPHIIYAKEGKAFVGGIISYIHGPILWIDALWIIPERRGQGIGKALLDQTINYGQTKDCTNIQLNTFFPKAHKFVTDMGFQTIASIPNWKYGLTCYLMEMKL